MKGPLRQLVLNIRNLNFEYATSLISDTILLYHLDQARPPNNVLHFLVIERYPPASKLFDDLTAPESVSHTVISDLVNMQLS